MSDDFPVDLANCDREPIHVLGAIQPIGFLLALTADWMIARASANLADYIGVSPDEAIGLPLHEIFPSTAVHDLRNRAAMLRGPDAVERLFDCEIVMGARHFDVAVHMSGGQVIVEAEPAGEHGDATGMVRSMNALSKGNPVLLNPQAYSTMALVVHDLVTNSVKYGGLSAAGGHVAISWARNADHDLVLTWCERGGPPVSPPTRKGFGTTIIDRSVPYDLGGAAEIEYKPAGVEARFRIPARHVSEPMNHAGPAIRLPRSSPAHPQTPPYGMLTDLDVLLVEDSLIIALDAEDIAQRLGAKSVSTAATVEGALDTIEAVKPDVAMLDINLGDANSFAIADRLLALGVPFLFATGYGEQAQLPPDHRGRTVVQKPYTIENVARAMDELLGRHCRIDASLAPPPRGRG